MSDAQIAKSLLQMAGAPLEPSKLDQSVIVMIDCQCEYVTGALPLARVDHALDNAAALLARGRTAATPVIHVAHKGKPGGLFDREGEGGRIEDRAAPRPGEPVVEKALPNAFAGTTLADAIAQTGRKELIIAGFMTHMCVSSTVRAALDLGFRATIVANATATRDLPGLDGGLVSADVLQSASLAALADRFAILVNGPDQLV